MDIREVSLALHKYINAGIRLIRLSDHLDKADQYAIIREMPGSQARFILERTENGSGYTLRPVIEVICKGYDLEKMVTYINTTNWHLADCPELLTRYPSIYTE